MMTFFLYPILTATFYYLGSRALITRFLWSRYPKWLDNYMLCAACSGFAYGVGVAFGLGWWLELPFLGLSGRWPLTPLIVGLCSTVWTPVVAAGHLWALGQTEAEGVDDVPAKEPTTGQGPPRPFFDDDDEQECDPDAEEEALRRAAAAEKKE